jgi:DNA-binding NtrC family response regulator
VSGTHTLSLTRDAQGRAVALLQPAVLLKVVRGPDRRRQLKAERPRILVGTGAADFTLTDRTVSAVHCALEWSELGLKVTDLGAKNGVRLDGRRVLEAYVESGAVLQLGTTHLKVQVLAEQVEQRLSPRHGFGRLVGSGLPMRRLYEELSRVAGLETTVLLTGETGVGKELAVEALVEQGPRRDGPVVVVDCGALAIGTAESELFGHEKGSFTGAVRPVAGAFERADGGTLLLDAVDELPLDLQPRLLGVLERRAVQRVGGEQLLPVDVHVLATAGEGLEQRVNAGRFRADLFYRLAGVQVRLPPLREHTEDVPQLVAHFLGELAAPPLAPAVLRRLCEADYPGNVRQLRSAVEQLSIGLSPPHLSASAPLQPDLTKPLRAQRDSLAEAFERRYLEAQLQQCGWNLSEAARRAGIDRMHLHRLVLRHGLERPLPGGRRT